MMKPPEALHDDSLTSTSCIAAPDVNDGERLELVGGGDAPPGLEQPKASDYCRVTQRISSRRARLIVGWNSICE